VRVGPDDVGRRVVLRHALADGRATDVLGELMAWDDPSGFARVATRHGEVAVPLENILLGKPVPPPPDQARRSRRPALSALSALSVPSIVELQDVMADGWQPLERAEYGGWRLRAAEGFTGRANSVLPLGEPPAPLTEAVDRAERWYAERGLPARFAVAWPLGSGPDEPSYGADPLEAELVRRGYGLDYPSLVMTRALSGESSSAEGAADRAPKGYRLEVGEEPDEGFLALYRYRGDDLPPVARRLLLSAPAQAFASVRLADSGRTVAIGRVASARGWSGVTAVEVAEDQRRRGLAGVVMSALHQWAAARGDHAAYLQVARHNTAARELYRGLGYTDHSGYHYRIRS
jgi:N-acetylglutamate synthase